MQIKYELFSDPILSVSVQPSINAAPKIATLSVRNAIKVWNTPIDSESCIADLKDHERQVGNVLWSPDGKLLLTTCDFAILWVVEGDFCKKKEKFPGDSGEILAAAWSPDSTRFITSFYNEIMAVHNIATGASNRYKLEVAARALSWDPLDRYIASLAFDNHVYIRKTTNFGNVFKRISLNVRCSKFTDNLTKRPERKIAWSPDCAYVISPSYEDMKEIPVACALSRRKDFDVDFVLAGPSSSISCVAFQDHIYTDEEKNENYCIFGTW